MRRREFIAFIGGAAMARPRALGAQQSSDVSASFFFRGRSFSLIYFAGMSHDAMPELLVRCGYSIIGDTQYNAPFLKILDTIEVVERPRNNIVRKATYQISGGRVLLDPEMVVAFVHAKVVARLCAEYRTDAFVACWERVSQTVIARHIDANGVVVADIGLSRGTLHRTPINPPAGIISSPSPASLGDFLATAGASPDEMFGSVSARLFKLDESGPVPHPR
jgi:hypothetical protein